MSRDVVSPSAENPPAFPRDHRHEGHNGMTLRDWFAGQVVAQMTHAGLLERDAPQIPAWKLAAASYAIADAMLAARQDATS